MPPIRGRATPRQGTGDQQNFFGFLGIPFHDRTREMWQFGTIALVLFASTLLNSSLPPYLFAADPSDAPLQVTINQLELPSSRQGQAILRSEARFLWDQKPLREGLRELSNLYGITIWIDRQIDPSQPITTQDSTQSPPTLQSRLRQIATVAGAEVGLIENVVYVGPPARVSVLQRAAIELHDRISRGADRAAQLRPWSWEEVTSSADLLKQLERQWNINILGPLPHDLYHAEQFMQPTTLATQLTVLVGGFGLQAEFLAPGRFELKPLQLQSQWRATYRKDDLGLRALPRWKSEYPGSECLTRGTQSHVQGITDFHLALLAPQPSSTVAAPKGTTARWGFEVRNTPVEAVLTKLASSLALEIQWDGACTDVMRSQLISFKVDQATTDQLLAEIGRVSGLKLVRDKQTVHVRP
jgi:hypothetical protein